MASVLYQGRAIPLLWTVVKGKKGHLPQELHCAVIERLQQVIPTTATVVVLGDGEFDGVALQATIRALEWDYVCRTASNITIYAHDRVFTVGDLPITRGESVAIADVEMTLARYGPVLVITLRPSISPVLLHCPATCPRSQLDSTSKGKATSALPGDEPYLRAAEAVQLRRAAKRET
jgi:hypothetical protein